MKRAVAILLLVTLSGCAALEATWYYLRCECERASSTDAQGAKP